MTQLPSASSTAAGETATDSHIGFPTGSPATSPTSSLADTFSDGTRYALTFGGQGGGWWPHLAELIGELPHEHLTPLLERSTERLAPIANQLHTSHGLQLAPHEWVRSEAPASDSLDSVAIAIPGVLLSQLAALDVLALEGLDPVHTPPSAALGHSQGILAVAALAARREGGQGGEDSDSEVLAIAHLLGAAATVAGRRIGLCADSSGSPMLAISGARPGEIQDLLQHLNEGVGERESLVISAVNGPRHVVVTGSPSRIQRLQDLIARRAEDSQSARKQKLTGGRPFNPTVEALSMDIGFHHPSMSPAVELVDAWANACGLDADLAHSLAQAIFVEPVRWTQQLHDGIDPATQWVIDVGPGGVAASMTARVMRGRGVTVVSAGSVTGREALFTPGAEVTTSANWSSLAPRVIETPQGPAVDTRFTRLTGKSPILLAGMTPTTVDPQIVAAAANAGHWAELAGGGQVTEQIFSENMQLLSQLLEPGATAQFNALLLDPYLWKLHLGGQRLVQNARVAGSPIDGVVVSAGIPELDDALDLIEDLRGCGIAHIAFKPGTRKQIDQVIAIAKESSLPIIVHVEGGVAGGHHSWEDLDDLLISRYAELRAVPNLVLCVGGGIGTPERAADYLTGAWSVGHDEAPMPVDGVLIGTAAMAALEATTSDQVKDLLVSTPGSPSWVGAGRSVGGVTSGQSQLGADIHEIDNSASRCGRLLDSVAGDADAVAAHRDDIIAALENTAKPYFGDIAEMTYEQVLQRFVELSTLDQQWRDPSFAQRFETLCDRALARVHEQTSGAIEPIRCDDPAAAIQTLVQRHPQATRCLLHPADVDHFIATCALPGKPVCFVPVIDADVRRWWRSDSLWQAHDSSYPSDQVVVIPGPVALAGITSKNEPIADLLERFERAAVARLVAESEQSPQPAQSRSTAGSNSGVVDLLATATDVDWCGRLVANPAARLGDLAGYEVVNDDCVVLVVNVGQGTVRLPFDVSPVRIGRAPLLRQADAEAAMTELLTLTAGGRLPQVHDGVAIDRVRFTADLVADHAAVTDPAHLGNAAIPDTLVGLAWPAIFAAIGGLEGLLDLVHLDHRIVLAHQPTPETELDVRATRVDTANTVSGRVITVEIQIHHNEQLIAELTERFLVRGRVAEAKLAAPLGVAPDREERPRALLANYRATSPARMDAFAEVSGDNNPLHTSPAAARMAGFDAPIVHGMWTSALAQRAVIRAVCVDRLPRIKEWLVRWTSPLPLDSDLSVSVERTGVIQGDLVCEVSVRTGTDLVLVADAVVAAPSTTYAFPGQGIQSRGMGLEERSASPAARQVWDRADEHTKQALGFSILAVVRDNPTELWADGECHRHPDGVLFLTQFTQVAMATLAVAQVARMREEGVFVEGAITCGHSVGEYNALAAVTGALPLESLIEIVFRRGMAMHHLVPRDAEGRSNFRLAAIRPSQADLPDEDLPAYIDDLAANTGEFIQIVNLNLRGSQYAIAGTVAGLAALEDDIEERRERAGGKPAFILVPGIDVPFHSRELTGGVAEFRDRLDDLLPERIDASLLVGRYVPNLVPRLFTLSREYVEEVAAYVIASTPTDTPGLAAALTDVLENWEEWAADPDRLTRLLLLELLAWQFASPVRWIETQDLLFDPPEDGGLAVEDFIEVGVATAPTLANLAAQTVAQAAWNRSGPRIYNSERDAQRVFHTFLPPSAADDEAATPEPDNEQPDQPAPEPATQQSPAVGSAAGPAADLARPDDLPFGAADATRLLISLRTKMRPDQIGAADTIESLCDGVSSRRNQLLVDLGAELSLGAIDGAAEATMLQLDDTISTLARTYRPFGAVLDDVVADACRSLAASHAAKPGAIEDRLTSVWQLGPGWLLHVQAGLAAGTREGSSARGGELAEYADAESLESAIDAAVAQVAQAHGIEVSIPTAAGPEQTVDAAALSEITASITGPEGVLASTARHLLSHLDDSPGEAEPDDLAEQEDPDAETARLVEAELGSSWPKNVTSKFDAKKAVLFDDRWASVREDFARLWHGDDSVTEREFAALDTAAQEQAHWWLSRARAAQRTDLVSFYGSVLSDDSPLPFGDDVAVVTGASPGSIAASVAAELLRGGASVVVTTSSLNSARLSFYRQLYRDHAAVGARLWVVPANLASYRDIDALVEWISTPVIHEAGGQRTEVRPGLEPTLVFPFAASSVQGTAADAGPRAELELRVLLWGMERLVTALAAVGRDHRLGRRIHVVLPGSPNRGRFGGDGAYGEAKAAFDAFVQRWHVESEWADRVSLVHALIGWVRGTGLMGHNDPIVDAVTKAGVRTWSPEEMATELAALCSPRSRHEAAQSPIHVDLTGGLDEVDLDLPALAKAALEPSAPREAQGPSDDDESEADELLAMTYPAGWSPAQLDMEWPGVSQQLEQMVCIVAAGEVGPLGSSRTRWQLEVGDELAPAGVIELAWVTGRITYEQKPTPGWVDAGTGDPLSEAEIVQRFGEEIYASIGIRAFHDDGQLQQGTAPLMVPVYLDQDAIFTCRTREEANAIAAEDPAKTRVEQVDDGYQVTRLKGSQVRVPRRFELSRRVGAQIPEGFDPQAWGLGSMTESIDRLSAWNLVATVDAFIGAGVTPAELLRWVHPTMLANTQGTGIGGIASTRSMYVDAMLGETPQTDILQEALPNVIAAHSAQAFLGGYGSMVHPVAACATAAVSLEEGVDKIRLGKAQVVVTGGFDDLGIEGIRGFGLMGATAETDTMRAQGIDDAAFCRPNDRRRGGFVEGQGGGTLVLVRGDLVAELGLPVMGVVAYAGSFSDGIHTSIPAPGLGALGAGCGGEQSPLGSALADLGLDADDIAVISKHDTSTTANDPNESLLHEKLADGLGRAPGNPLYVVSQKSITGHAKGGAAAFQMIGLCQLLSAGVIPGQRHLDCVDEVLADHQRLLWPRERLQTDGLRAGLVTSLGFGHVSAVVAIAHAAAFVAALDPSRREEYLARAQDRRRDGESRLLWAMHGGEPAFVKTEHRRFANSDQAATQAAEIQMLLDPQARLSVEGRYQEATNE